MKFENEELDNLCKLLNSTDLSNISIGLELLQANPENIKETIAPLLLIQFGWYGYNQEEDEIINKSKVLLKANLNKIELKSFEDQLICFKTMRNYLPIRWTDFLQQLKKYELHQNYYEKYILANPQYQYSIYHDLAYYISHKFKKHLKAYSYIKKVIDTGTDDLNIKSEFIELLVNELLNLDKCFEEIPRIIVLINEQIEAYPYQAAEYNYTLGILYDLYLLDKNKAIEHYKEALVIDPKHDGAMNNLANIYYKEDRDYEIALDLVQKSLKLSPKDYNSLDTLGCIYFYGFKNYPEAIKAFEKALKIKKTHHYSITGLGEVHEEIGDYPKAVGYYLQGLKYRPKSEYKLSKLANLYLKMGEKEEAEKFYSKLLRLYPKNQDARLFFKKED